MVRGDDQSAVQREGRLGDCFDTRIDRFNRANSRLNNPRMPNHIRIGKINTHKIGFVFLNFV